MRTTVELPDDLLRNAKTKAASAGLSLREFFIEAVEQRLTAGERVREQPEGSSVRGWDEFFDLLNSIDIPSSYMAERPLNLPPTRRGVFDS